ncbi:MAG: M1 family metallopeptidase [Bacteroidetes bacterium]|nr:M1 family metallopeptidase [Bacteroidota bacterium]
MLRFFYIISFLFTCSFFYSQQNYFQQEVNYTIDVTLNDVSHELSAFEKITYINNSKQPLDFIYFHLWANAYKNQETALARQLLENGETEMYFAKPSDLGYIDSLNFLVNGKTITWEFDKEHIDICKLILNKPINPGDTIIITTPFHVKLPSAKISRLGHIGQAYAITQWYPKPAVFDRDGWHPMPYLNQGEFYSEFGSYNVKITLPKNYVLAATGDRIDEAEEENWLLSKVEETKKLIADKKYSHDNSFPESSKEYKTIQFKQYRVHDFAWFADKRFHVLKGTITLPRSLKEVDTWAFFTNSEPELWSKSLEYINDATLFYSDMNGDYPYNHVTAVDGTISAGGGMEYPNITIIGESGNAFTLETTIMHEVGHNWFYGILGSNERDYPFMDEGLNSFYEMRYIRAKYPNQTLASLIGRDSTFKFFGLNKFKHKAEYEFSYLLAARKNTDQPIATASEDFTPYNYGAIVYSKSALAFDYLMNYLGKEKFDEAMRFYFEQWKFEHPTPEDLIKTLQYHLNADLHWFVEELIVTNNKLDYKMVGHKQLEDHSHAILVKNKNKLLGPVSVSGLKDGRLVGTVWYNGFKGKRVFEFPPSDVDEFKIDYEEFMPDVKRKNNNIRTHGIFRTTDPVKFVFLGKLDDPNYSQINYLPIAGYNQYNKFMLGCAFYNYSFLQRKMEFTIAPMYAFGSKTPVGFADFNKYFTQNNNVLQQITFTAKAKSFAYNYVDTKFFNEANSTNIKSFNLNYYKISATLDFELKKRVARSKITQHIGYTSNYLFTDNETFKINRTDSSQSSIGAQNKATIINNFYYTLQNTRVINPFDVAFNFQHNDLFGKASASLNYSITFKNKNSLDFRLFAGAFVFQNSNLKQDYRFRMSGFNGTQDYLFDYNYVGRNEINGVGAAQMVEKDGAFKIWTPLGQTSKWLIALNIKSPKVGKLPLKLYADIGASEFKESLLKDRILYNAGVDICLWKNIFEIYVPFVYSNDIKTALTANNKGFFDTIRFTLNLHNINPRNFITNSFL